MPEALVCDKKRAREMNTGNGRDSRDSCSRTRELLLLKSRRSKSHPVADNIAPGENIKQ